MQFRTFNVKMYEEKNLSGCSDLFVFVCFCYCIDVAADRRKDRER